MFDCRVAPTSWPFMTDQVLHSDADMVYRANHCGRALLILVTISRRRQIAHPLRV
jgi:hypothetical protein